MGNVGVEIIFFCEFLSLEYLFLKLLTEHLLSAFVGRCADLYGATGATFNVHQLLHLASSVRNLGPLWANSAFVFESGNGKIVKSVTAANGLPHQIVERVAMAQQLDLCVATLNISEDEREICEAFLGHTRVSNAVLNGDVTLLGLNRHAELSNTEKQLLHELGYGSADCYDRFMLKKQVYHSMLYKRPS